MSWLDWGILLVPLISVYILAFYSRRYIRSVADFLSAGRVCGRYVLGVADTASALSVISIIAYVEVQYRTGFALAFWNNLLLPVLIIMGLTGYCTYRFRETRAMSMGQFLEMRYSRSLRIFAAVLRSGTEIFGNVILPALAARFFIYFLGIPAQLEFFGMTWPTFPCLMAVLLAMALVIVWMGGALALIITDALQGMFCFLLMAAFAVFVLWKFPWTSDIVPVMTNRVAGESFLNPFDIEQLRDFNVFALLLSIWVAIFHRASWIGNGSSSAARSAHEQKMAGLLGMWRSSLATVFYVLVAVAVLVVMNHADYASMARGIRNEIVTRVTSEVGVEPTAGKTLVARAAAIPEQRRIPGVDAPASEKDNLDTPYLDNAREILGDSPEGNRKFQEFRTLYHQLMLPVAMRQTLPTGLLGAFSLLMILAMISTDDARMFSSALTIAQDIVLVIRKKAFTVAGHVRMVRLVTLGVALCFFVGSLYMAQLDYINLFLTLASMMWLCGCGPVMIFGLYSRFGTAAGAWSSLIGGVVWAGGSLFIQRNWANMVYPFLAENSWTEAVGFFLEMASRPMHPYIVWKMDAVKCPVNSYELYFIGMLITLVLYCAVSQATCRQPFDLAKMLHRTPVDRDEKSPAPTPIRESLASRLVGITPEYTRGDKILAWGVFLFTFVYTFIGCFIGVIVWNFFSPWPSEYWGNYFRIVSVIVPGILAAFTTVWFCWGGIRDLRRMFRDLAERQCDDADDGRVPAKPPQG